MIKGIPAITDTCIPFPNARLKLLLVSINKSRPFQAREVVEAAWKNDHSSCIDIILVLDSGGNVNDLSYVAWKMFNNANPGADMMFYGKNRLAIDVTKKCKEEGFLRDWPEELCMDKEIVAKIDSLWNDLNIN